MGLLDLEDPQRLGLLSLGLRLMSTPGRFGQALGTAGMGALGDIQQATVARDQKKSRDLQRQMLEMQMQQAKRQAEMERVGEEAAKSAFVPGMPGMVDTEEGSDGLNMPAQDPRFDMTRYMTALAQGGNAKGAMQAYASMQKDDTPMVLSDGGLLVTKSGKVLASNPKEPKEPTPTDLARLLTEFSQLPPNDPRRAVYMDAIKKATSHSPGVSVSYGAPVPGVDGSGRPVFFQPGKDGGPPVIVPGVSPPKSAAEEKADAEKKTKGRQSQQMIETMDAAEKILKTGSPTASGVGTVLDAGARAVGVSTIGARDAARLQALSGWLVANVPRMEGPQSNFDVQNYMVMAGKIGDSTVPVKERVAALQEVRKLQRKYADINETPIPKTDNSAPTPSVTNW